MLLRTWSFASVAAFITMLPQTSNAEPLNRFQNSLASGWTFRSGALFLDGGGSLPDLPLLTRGNLIPVLQSREIDTGIGTGWEIELGKRLNRDWSFDTRYFRIDSLEETLTASNLVNGAGVRYRNTVAGVLGAVTGSYRLNYGADVESLELLARRRATDWLSISAGVRYLRFDDQLSVSISGGPFTSSSAMTASNEMTGAQLGSDLLLIEHNRFSVIARGAAGLYHNDTDASLLLRNVNTRTSFFKDTRTSFAGEVELKGRYYLRKHVFAEAGYRLLFLEDIALASEQAIINNAPGTGAMTAIDSSDNRMLQGATMSLVFQF